MLRVKVSSSLDAIPGVLMHLKLRMNGEKEFLGMVRVKGLKISGTKCNLSSSQNSQHEAKPY